MTHTPPQLDGFAVVVLPYEGRRPGELTLKVGDRVKISKKGPQNWIGSSAGKVGSFPQTCVEMEKINHKPPTNQNRPASSYTPIPNHGGPVPMARSYSNSNCDTKVIPPPMKVGKLPKNLAFPVVLPPPPSSLVGIKKPPTTGVRTSIPSMNATPSVPRPQPPKGLPKFGEIVDHDDLEPTPPPRSPRKIWTFADLPPMPPRQIGAHENTQATEAVEEKAKKPEKTAEEIEAKKREKDDMRKKCITEIYETEAAYIVDLETIIDVFIFPLRTMQVVSDKILYNIFSNVEVLINCNKEMLRELSQVMDAQTGEEVQIGEVFTKLADYFKMYKVFCANQQNSLSAVDQNCKKNSEFKKNLEVCHSDPRCKGLFLQSFLIKPIQRVCKYPLLLRELIKYTPEGHPDHQPLQNAFEKINQVVANINEGQRQAEGLQRIIDLQKLIDGVDTLVAPNRNLQKEGDLNFYKNAKSKHPEKRHVFFFSDLILLTIKKGDKKYEHKMSISLENCTFTLLADSGHLKNAFELRRDGEKKPMKCILGCDTLKEANDWAKNIKVLIKEYQKRKFSELRKMKEQGLNPITQIS